ncbi:MAG: response regulator [Halieaceae bacterium]
MMHAPSTHSPAVHGRKVLYVEDDRTSTILFEAMMEGMDDVSLFLTETAEEGIMVARREQPDFIFLDIDLPRMDGITALRVLKADPNLDGCKIIGLSANAMPEQVSQAEGAGFDGYITKPYLLEQITDIVDGD